MYTCIIGIYTVKLVRFYLDNMAQSIRVQSCGKLRSSKESIYKDEALIIMVMSSINIMFCASHLGVAHFLCEAQSSSLGLFRGAKRGKSTISSLLVGQRLRSLGNSHSSVHPTVPPSRTVALPAFACSCMRSECT